MVHSRGDTGAVDGEEEEGSLGVAWRQQTAVG